MATASLDKQIEDLLSTLSDRAIICSATFRKAAYLMARGLPIPGRNARVTETPHGRAIDKITAETGAAESGASASYDKALEDAIGRLPDDGSTWISTRTFKRIGAHIVRGLPLGGTGTRVYESPHGRVVDAPTVEEDAAVPGGSTSLSSAAASVLNSIGDGFLGGASLKRFMRAVMRALPTSGTNCRIYESPHGRIVDFENAVGGGGGDCTPAFFLFLLADPFEDPYELGAFVTFTLDGLVGTAPITVQYDVNGALRFTGDTFEFELTEEDVLDIDPETRIGHITITARATNACGTEDQDGVIHVHVPE